MVFYYLLETWVHKVEKRQKYCLYIVFIYTYLHIQKTFSEFPPPYVFPTTWSSVITNYGIAASCVPSLCLYVWPLCPLASTLTITEPPPSYKCGMKTMIKLPQHRPPPSFACVHRATQNVRICFIMTSLCIVHLTNTQSLIFPLNTSLSRWLHLVLGRKGHTIKWLRPSVHVIEWWCITPGWLYVYLTHCEHEYDFRDH